ncbi:MAG: hypothetical protein KA072_02065 [Thermoanaerobaculaceae bacterium]|nr:hypothetical protein [Thermoanaerobaculaceae bacterium]MDI9621587.1 hypothetical protein [Acidobacteriota bacterium]
MYLTAMTQREKLFKLAIRWLKGQLEPDDGRFLTLAFLIDHAITAPVLAQFLSDLAAPPGAITRVDHLRVKGEVRGRIARACACPGSRTRQLLDLFRAYPERFFPTTPVDLFAICGEGDDLAAMVRLKNLGRLADKVSRRATARCEPEIRRRAEGLLSEPRRFGVDLGDHVLAKAERLVCLDLESGALALTPQDLQIDDLIGLKLIGGSSELERLEAKVAAHPQVVSVRRSEHHGKYTDKRLDVELVRPGTDETVERLLAQKWQPSSRGLNPDELRRAIPTYVEDSSKTFFVEVILTTWEDLVESEFGRGLHEERTEKQRDGLRRAPQLSANVAMTMMFMLLVAIAPTTEVVRLPFRLSGRYLPDAMMAILGNLFGLEIDRSPLWLPRLTEEQSVDFGSLNIDGAPVAASGG